MKRSSSGRIDLPLAQGRNIFGWGRLSVFSNSLQPLEAIPLSTYPKD